MPQPWTIGMSYSANAAIIARGTADPPTSIPFMWERSHLPGFASSVFFRQGWIFCSSHSAIEACYQDIPTLTQVLILPILNGFDWTALWLRQRN